MHYNWHRHYDPSLGRYTQPDPLGFVDGPSVYAYGRNSPVSLTDRTGRAAVVNHTSRPIVVGGGTGTGRGHDGKFVNVVLPPGGRIDRCHPIDGLTDVDTIDKNGDGVAEEPISNWDYFKEKVPGDDCFPVLGIYETSGGFGMILLDGLKVQDCDCCSK